MKTQQFLNENTFEVLRTKKEIAKLQEQYELETDSDELISLTLKIEKLEEKLIKAKENKLSYLLGV